MHHCSAAGTRSHPAPAQHFEFQIVPALIVGIFMTAHDLLRFGEI
jgi:hypothetical protein